MISSNGIALIANLRAEVLDPDQVPPTQIPPKLPAEVLPVQAPDAVISQKFAELENTIRDLTLKTFGPTSDQSNIAVIKKRLIADALNGALDPKRLTLSFRGPMQENGPQDEIKLKLGRAPDLNCKKIPDFCNPTGLCFPPWVSGPFNPGSGPFNSGGCEPVNTAQCQAQNAFWETGCEIMQIVIDLLSSVEIGRVDWRIRGVGDDAISGQASLAKAHVTEVLDRVDIGGVTAKGSVRAEGWAQIDINTLLYGIPGFLFLCPPLPCTDCRIQIKPTDVPFEMGGMTLGGQFGISPFRDDTSKRDRNGFYIHPDSFDVTARVNVAEIGQLMRDNASNLPCILNPTVALTYGLTDVALSSSNIDINLTKHIDVEKTRIGWADSDLQLPIAWKYENGQPTVSKKVPLHLDYYLSGSAVTIKSGTISAPNSDHKPTSYRQQFLLDLSYGLSTGVVFAAQRSSAVQKSSGNFFSPINPYVNLNYRSPFVGGFLSFVTGPTISDYGAGLGVTIRPSSRLPKLRILAGTRLGNSGKNLKGGPKFMLGVGWDIEKLSLRACERKSK